MKITEPTLLVDESTVRRNLEKMTGKTFKHGLELKPHVKTHQSIAIGTWMREYGIEKITVSSVGIAEYFAQAGWDDITIAFPCNPLLGNRLNDLAKKINLSILISDPTAFSKLQNVLNAHFQVYIEIDTGAKRTGFQPSEKEQIEKLAMHIGQSNNFHFKGFYSHAGHSYQCRNKTQIRAVHQHVVKQMQQLKSHFKPSFPNLLVCIGDTPCCSVAKAFNGIDEISAGNFIFYDLMQQQIGSCREHAIAVALACPVVAVYPQRLKIAIHGGAIHLSKESLHDGKNKHFGKVVTLDSNLCWKNEVTDCFVQSISQEHGIIHCSHSFLESVEVGDIIGILPVHSCLAADAMRKYLTTRTFDKLDHLQNEFIPASDI